MLCIVETGDNIKHFKDWAIDIPQFPGSSCHSGPITGTQRIDTNSHYKNDYDCYKEYCIFDTQKSKPLALIHIRTVNNIDD